jgi:hypothetical protein
MQISIVNNPLESDFKRAMKSSKVQVKLLQIKWSKAAEERDANTRAH